MLTASLRLSELSLQLFRPALGPTRAPLRLAMRHLTASLTRRVIRTPGGRPSVTISVRQIGQKSAEVLVVIPLDTQGTGRLREVEASYDTSDEASLVFVKTEWLDNHPITAWLFEPPPAPTTEHTDSDAGKVSCPST